MARLILVILFIGVPLVELALLIEVGRFLGTVATIGLVVATGVAGAALARHQGVGVLRHMRTEIHAGRLPAGSLVDGAIILVAAALLVTPGILTDGIGFLCLVPAFRRALKVALWRRLEHAVRVRRWMSIRMGP